MTEVEANHTAGSQGRQTCPRCKGKGTIVKDGPSEWEYDSRYPCPRCTTDRTELRGTGLVPVRGVS